MEQAKHFLEESEALSNILVNLSDTDFERATLFKSWTINDILVHLHFWNKAADLALNAPDEFDTLIQRLFSALNAGRLRDFENNEIAERGKALLDVWEEGNDKLGRDFSNVDPKTRVKWAGPDMSARTCISARQMEVWAHGQAIFDLLGQEREDADSVKNIVMLGINAFGWTHKVHGLGLPEHMPRVKLRAPSGEVWEYGETQHDEQIEGSAVEFAQVVTQTRNILDTQLNVTGHVAAKWMAYAQCFAGPPNMPPKPGTRYMA